MLTQLLMRSRAMRGLLYPRYNFQYFPRQLRFLMECLDETAQTDGAILEIGCAFGVTTTLMYEYLKDGGVEKRVVCVDTFAGFTAEDIRHERARGKTAAYESLFSLNRIEWFREALAARHITDVETIPADICTLAESALPERVAFCLLDVDLYRPVLAGLRKVFPRLSPGGIIVVDDCWTTPRHMWVSGVAEVYDGAMVAYRQFAAENGLEERFAEKKLGLFRKGRAEGDALGAWEGASLRS